MEISNIRNIGFVAHIDAGKTTTTERVLYLTHKIHRIGEVDDGTATMDWMPQEKERGITITSAATTCYWKDYRINIIDTPGHVDFTAEVEKSMRILDGLVVIFCAVEGVEAQSETIWHQASRFNVPRIVFINKMDRIGADSFKVLREIQEKFGKKPLLMQLPVGKEKNFEGVIDLLTSQKILWNIDSIGEQYSVNPVEKDEEIQKWQEELFFTIGELNEKAAESFFEGKKVEQEEVRSTIRKGVVEGKLIPVFLGSALKNKGIQPLLDAICFYLPSPMDRKRMKGKNPISGSIEEREVSVDASFSGVVFKISVDKKLGKLLFTRIYSGKISTGDKVLNIRTGEIFKIQRLYLLHANRRNILHNAFAGEIVGIIGSKDTITGDTICSAEHPIIYEEMIFPEPVVFQSIEPKTTKDLKKLEDILEFIRDEDPTFKVKKDEETGQLIISGIGELHLEIIADRIKREFGIPVKVGKPQVSYRETITQERTVQEKFSKTIGEIYHYAEVEVSIYPNNNKGNRIFIPDEISNEFKDVIKKVTEETLLFGPIAGYPVVDTDIKYKRVIITSDTTPLSLSSVCQKAIRRALSIAEPEILEPVVQMHITLPSEFVGNVVSDLGARNSALKGIFKISDVIQRIYVTIPLRETFGYATVLRSLTHGRGNFWMKLSHFTPVPQQIKKKIMV